MLNFLKQVIFVSCFFLLLSCASEGRNLNRNEQGLKSAVEDLRKATKETEKAFSEEASNEDLLDLLAKVQKSFLELKVLTPVKGDKDLLVQYCDAGLGIVGDSEAQVRRQFRNAAKTSFLRVKNLQKDISKDFAFK